MWQLCYRFFSSALSLCKAKGYYYWKHNFCRTSMSNVFDIAFFLLSSLVTGQSFMSISSLVLELWQFSFKSGNRKYPRRSFAQYLETGASYGYNILGRMSLIESYWMLQNDARVTAFTVNELLRENQLDREGGENYPPPPTLPQPRLGLNLIRSDLKVLMFPPQHIFVKFLCDHFITIIF